MDKNNPPATNRVKALGPVKFRHIPLFLNGVKGFGPPGDVTVEAAGNETGNLEQEMKSGTAHQ